MNTIKVDFKSGKFSRSGHCSFNGWHQIASDESVLFSTNVPEGSEQLKLDWFVTNEEKFYRIACDYLLTNTSKLLEYFEFDDGDLAYFSSYYKLDAKRIAEGDILSMIRLKSVVIPHTDKDVIGFGFDCVWDDEHGLGIVIYKDQVISCNEESSAYECLDFEDVFYSEISEG
ncbi:DUF6985 domain-containing protein [Litoribacillus peritrichatus]|uniref:DUF6985 domain-containing protein n=1 Tax=Litoribacillus peritrichatus TaxID=718191 RepID=A0ABP7MUH2_9GAMM